MFKKRCTLYILTIENIFVNKCKLQCKHKLWMSKKPLFVDIFMGKIQEGNSTILFPWSILSSFLERGAARCRNMTVFLCCDDVIKCTSLSKFYPWPRQQQHRPLTLKRRWKMSRKTNTTHILKKKSQISSFSSSSPQKTTNVDFRL